MEKVLHLTLKKKWFDMIANGEKKAEYREIKQYWINRLIQAVGTNIIDDVGVYIEFVEDIKNPLTNHNSLEELLDFFNVAIKKYDYIVFKNGYSPNAPTLKVECLGIEVGKAKPEWSDNWQGDVFIIKLGKIINQ